MTGLTLFPSPHTPPPDLQMPGMFLCVIDMTMVGSSERRVWLMKLSS